MGYIISFYYLSHPDLKFYVKDVTLGTKFVPVNNSHIQSLPVFGRTRGEALIYKSEVVANNICFMLNNSNSGMHFEVFGL